MRRRGRLLLLLAVLGLWAAGALPHPSDASDASDARVLEGVPYAGTDSRDQSLDLYLPRMDGGPPPPLLAFVHSRFWDRRDRARDVVERLARPLQRLGLAVAVVRHRLAPESVHPAAAEDVAAAVAFLVEHAGEYGYDRSRIHLGGRSSGAQLAALVALDPRYLAAHGVAPDALRSVVGWSGAYDLDPPEGSVPKEMLALYEAAFGGRQARRDASPIRHVRADAPLFLLLSAQSDLPGATADAAAFAKALRDAGDTAAEAFAAAGRDHFDLIDMGDSSNPARRHVLALLGVDESYGSIEDIFATRRFWRAPSFSTAGFWKDESRVETHDADERFLATLNALFAQQGHPPPLRPSRYHALDLLDYVARHAPGGGGDGDFLAVTNVRGEQIVWRRSELRAYHPVIVIGLDDQRELFRLTDFYHTLRRYTWKQPQAETWVLARPLGAFIHFLEKPPARLDPKLFGRYALQPDGFSVSERDPYAPLRDLPEAEQALLTETFRCVSCHRFRGVGARAGHLRARDGELVGGFGLPLEEYPPAVWRRYCFDQTTVAAEIGASAVPLGEHARTLFELVERERAR